STSRTAGATPAATATTAAPRAHRARDARARVEAAHAVGAAVPYDVFVGAIGDRPPTLGAAAPEPQVFGNSSRAARGATPSSAPTGAGEEAVARPVPYGTVLAGAVHAVGHAVIERDAVDLADGEIDVEPRPSAIRGDVHVAIVGDDDPLRIQRIDPD